MDPVQHSPVCQSDKDLRLQVAVDAGGDHKLLLVVFAPTEFKGTKCNFKTYSIVKSHIFKHLAVLVINFTSGEPLSPKQDPAPNLSPAQEISYVKPLSDKLRLSLLFLWNF